MTSFLTRMDHNKTMSIINSIKGSAAPRPLTIAASCLLLYDSEDAGTFAHSLHKLMELVATSVPETNPVRLILVITNPAPDPDPAAVALARLTELAGQGWLELVTISIAGSSWTTRVIAGASRAIELADMRSFGSVIAELTPEPGTPVTLPPAGWASVEGSVPYTPSVSYTEPRRIEVACGVADVRFDTGTDIDYVTQLIRQLAAPQVAPPTYEHGDDARLLDARLHLETHLHVRRFFETLNGELPTSEQLSTLIRSDLRTHIVLRQMAEDLDEALTEPRIEPYDNFHRARLQGYWTAFDDSPARRTRAIALSTAYRDALTTVTDEMQSTRAIR